MNKHFKSPFYVLALAGLTLIYGSGSAKAGNGNDQPTGDASVGQVTLGAPGVGLNYATVSQAPFSRTASIGRFYKFVFTGIEAQSDSDGVAGSYPWDGYMWDRPKPKSNNGHGNNCDGVDSSNPGKSKKGLDSDPTVDDECKGKKGEGSESGTTEGGSVPVHISGWWEMWAKVNSKDIGKLAFSSPKLHDISGVMRRYLSTPVTFWEEDITLNWYGNGNTKDPDGHLYILGEAIKEPPAPTGSLSLNQTHYQQGEKPPFGWDVLR